MNRNTSIAEVAECFTYLSMPGTKKSVNHRKLQTLVYYSQALSFAVNKRSLFDEDFEAWVHSPMSPALYYKYKKYRFNDIPRPSTMPYIEEDDLTIIKIAWAMYGECDDKLLENKVHRELPFQLIRGELDWFESSNDVIPKELIKEYYSRKFKVNFRSH